MRERQSLRHWAPQQSACDACQHMLGVLACVKRRVVSGSNGCDVNHGGMKGPFLIYMRYPRSGSEHRAV
jgi:hypothetical protein